MLDLRIYRAAFLPLALAVVLVAFSLGTRPRPLGTTLVPEAFDGATAMRDLTSLARAYPDRRPGSAGDDALAAVMDGAFRHAGFATRTVTYTGDTVVGRRTLETVIGTRLGTSSRSIVIVAPRDAARPFSQAELSASAALLELVRVFSGRVTQRTLTLVSTSGGSGGAAGAADLSGRLAGGVDAVIVLGDLGGTRSRRPYVVPWSDGFGLAPIQLRRTVESGLEQELGRSPGGTAMTDQLVRLAFPLTVGDQGPLLAAGYPAVLVQGSGEVGPSAGDGISQARLQAFGRGVLRAVTALDGGPDVKSSPTRDVLVGARTLPGWGVRILIAALILPALVASIDMLARVRRRRADIVPWFAWVAANAVPFGLAGAFAAFLGRTGLLRAAPTGPVTTVQLPLGTGGRTALISVALLFGLSFLARARLIGRLRVDLPAPGAAAAVSLTLCGLALLTWWANPYAAALLILPLHLWLLAAAVDPPPRRPAGLVIVLVALIPLGVLMGLDAARLSLGPESFAWTGMLLVAGGHVPLGSILLWSIAAGCFLATIEIVARRAAQRPSPPPVTVRGPVSYAGPGSLGGTDSALRR